MTVYMFDRDYTVDVNPPTDGKNAVPLQCVKYLAHETDHPVWATGNQHLRREALIPGLDEAKEIWEDMRGEDIENEYSGDHFLGSYKPSRRDGLRIIQELHPDQDEFIVIDDVNLEDMSEEGIHHYYPWDFYDAIEQREFPVSLEAEGQTNEPENANDIDVDKFLEENNFFENYESLYR